MTKEELEKLKSTVKQWLFHTGSLDPANYANELKLKFIEPREKRIEELEKACDETQELLDKQIEATYKLDKENAELKSIADFQQSGNMSRYFELKRQAEKLEEAKELLKKLLVHSKRYIWIADDNNKPIMQKEIAEAEQFLSEVEK